MLIDQRADRFMLARTAAPRRPGSCLLEAVLELAGSRADLVRHAERPWASITFSGTRHTVLLDYRGEEAIAEAETFIAALPEHQFDIAHQLVADAAIVAITQDALPEPHITVEAELLLLEDA